MNDRIVEVHSGNMTVLFAWPGALSCLPANLRYSKDGASALRRIASDPDAARQVRRFWTKRACAMAHVPLSDRELLADVELALRRQQIMVIPLPNVKHAQLPSNTEFQNRIGAPKKLTPPRIITGDFPARLTGTPPPLPVMPPMQRPVTQWPISDRLTEVLDRTWRKKLVGEAQQVLRELADEKNLALMGGVTAAALLAQGTPVGWVIDTALLALAWGYGGIQAVYGLGHIMECVEQTANATTLEDLDRAADTLAKAVRELSAVLLLLLLHKLSARSSAKRGGAAKSVGKSEPPARELPARTTTPTVEKGPHLGTNITPKGRQITQHASERMSNPGKGRVPMSPEEVDQVLDGATRVVKREYHPEGNTLTIENANMLGKPRVIVDEATGQRVITVIKNRPK